MRRGSYITMRMRIVKMAADPEPTALPLYLGLDLSTQQLKAVCIDEQLRITHEYSVDFDDDLPEFKTSGGVHKSDDGLTVTTPTLLWVKALDRLLNEMQKAGFPFGRVVGVSGSGQQHGSVYWRQGAGQVLAQLQPNQSLYQQLQGCFSVAQSPVWMDSSTTSQCALLEEACGGPLALAQLTGSRAYEVRFTGIQIAKIYQNKSCVEAYREFDSTERISLVSSFIASLFLGGYASIDYSDGSGMNLLDITSKQWSSKALEASAPHSELCDKLGDPVPSNTVLGPISPYYTDRFGFSSDCKIIAFTGDNPSSLAGMRLLEGDIVMSLGTSDTLIMWLDSAQPQLMGHVFVNPVDSSAFMAMLCYKNGSKTREMVRDGCASHSWEEFNCLLDKTEPGNSGNIGIYFKDPEITPRGGQGFFHWNSSGTPVSVFPPEVEVRAIVEGQFMAKWNHAQRLGYHISPTSRILATGGASQNTAILQIIADIFSTDVYVLGATANSASLGGAYRAKHALMPSGTRFLEAVKEASAYTLAVAPRQHVHKQVYQPLCKRYAALDTELSQAKL